MAVYRTEPRTPACFSGKLQPGQPSPMTMLYVHGAAQDKSYRAPYGQVTCARSFHQWPRSGTSAGRGRSQKRRLSYDRPI
jgi:hypothetical protein